MVRGHRRARSHGSCSCQRRRGLRDGQEGQPDAGFPVLPNILVFREAGSGQKVCQSTETEQVGDEEEANVNVTFAGADEILTGSDGLDVSDPTTGTSWHSAPTNVGLPGAPVADSLPAIVNGVVFITENGTLVAYDLNGCGSAICAPIWQTTFIYGDPGPPYFQPTVANNTIYVWGPNAIDSWQVAPLPAHIVRPGAPYEIG